MDRIYLQNYPAEGLLIKKYASSSIRIFEDWPIEFYNFNNPFTKYLKDKKVLVISPFAESIKSQYLRRNVLWDNSNILPEFQLITYKFLTQSA